MSVASLESTMMMFRTLDTPEAYRKRVDDQRVASLTIPPSGNLKTVTMMPRGPPLETTSEISTMFQPICAPSTEINGVPLSEQYPPATAEHRSFQAHDILMIDTRPEARRDYAVHGPKIPSLLLTNTFRGVAVKDAHKLRFFGVAKANFNAKKAGDGMEDNLGTVRMTDKLKTRNAASFHVRAMDALAVVAPKAKPELGVDGKVDTTKYPSTGILDYGFGETGDGKACPPVFKRVNTASPYQRFHTVFVVLLLNPAVLLGDRADAYLNRGDASVLRDMMEGYYNSLCADTDVDANDKAVCDALWSRFQMRVEALLPDTRKYVQTAAEMETLGQSDTFVLLTDDDAHYRRTLAHEKMVLPYWASDRAAAELQYMKHLADTMNSTRPRVSNLPRLSEVNFPDGMLLPATAGFNDMAVKRGRLPANFADRALYAQRRRQDVALHVLEMMTLEVRSWSALVLSISQQADLIATSDSGPGDNLSCLVVRHS